ncbi:hypothetical protein D8W71_09560 [Rhodococcus sp. P1Y]|nr:hypothetical protein D8W71_09560 [Rhodococcus sp. P1Y]
MRSANNPGGTIQPARVRCRGCALEPFSFDATRSIRPLDRILPTVHFGPQPDDRGEKTRQFRPTSTHPNSIPAANTPGIRPDRTDRRVAYPVSRMRRGRFDG